MSVLVLMLVISTVAVAGIFVIAKWDEPVFAARMYLGVVTMGALTGGMLIRFFCVRLAYLNQLVLGIFVGCLLLASITDSVLCQVYNFVWWVAYAAGGILLWTAIWQQGEASRGLQSVNALFQMILFVLLQFGVFGRTYGRADCYAFCACALVETALGMTMEGYMFHMILAYVLLILVQIFRRNVSHRGGLKRPVPFLPYIHVTFWVTIILKC